MPGRADEVSLYVCGPTVQSAPHVGHLRSALVYDLWGRWFSYRGYKVTLVRNVTDIDDKILQKASQKGEPWWALASRVEAEFQSAADSLRIQRPDLQPRATGDIPAMVGLVQLLLDRGHAYVSKDGSGDVYFEVRSFPKYGELSNQDLENLAQGEGEVSNKRSPEDFALWKGHKDGEPETAAWAAPWGLGRPGWHLECSAMASRYLGQSFDIHGGGVDLRFPHHENELAQSLAAGHNFASYWMHNALVLVGGQKMSKSLGNSVFASDLLDSNRPLVVRYALCSAHYRSELDLQANFLDEARAAFERIEGFLIRATQEGARFSVGDLPIEFQRALDQDLATPQAFAVIHERVRKGNQALEEANLELVENEASAVRAMLAVLGLDPFAIEWKAENTFSVTRPIESLMQSLIALRNRAREAGDFAQADELRDAIDSAGIEVKDSDRGSTWSYRG